MRNTFKAIAMVTILTLTGCNSAGDDDPKLVLRKTDVLVAKTPVSAEAKRDLTQVALTYVFQSSALLKANDIDRAIGYAMVGRDIAHEAGNTELVGRIDELLAVYRTINMWASLATMRKGGIEAFETINAMQTLMCRMNDGIAPELRRIAERYIGNQCEPI